MLGMNQDQRSNAVGLGTAYIPDADPGRSGGNTYTGNSAEPTLQDYENFFGPSARDIKTDLQRFKRHGRWHLPDILKGPNPWLTDRIDGLITDATNSPFTTKLLPYRYKEDVDGKIKWNVWSFDEGMASRVPYESAARTLTQSKRSFAGYMVRQGMAIVLEHNFMMTPKGRENFKNQLNQLIGSIQYTNDLDVHMALVLAPSYQKTMRERYYTVDKAASQVCREFVDLFGMMQKNVNALDILIEEGKAILRTWGGPMPDFLLCNSKLTFQMTMTPEKTNYITQGMDGVKRLRQGPDLASYRGLSVIHSRSFAMETGQQPRDILRRRVRTAEYYRILPNKKNVTREFEFYNEERDTWFTLSFMDLLKYARYHHQPSHAGGQYGRDNPSRVDRVYHALINASSSGPDSKGARDASGFNMMGSLGVPAQTGDLTDAEKQLVDWVDHVLKDWKFPLHHLYAAASATVDGTSYSWTIYPFSNDLGIKHIHLSNNRLWDEVQKFLSRSPIPDPVMSKKARGMLGIEGRLTPGMARDLFLSLENIPLNHPFKFGELAQPRTAEWFLSYSFYVDVYRRGGIPMDLLREFTTNPVSDRHLTNHSSLLTALKRLSVRAPMISQDKVNLQYQFLGPVGAVGSVNHVFFNKFVPDIKGSNQVKMGKLCSQNLILTYEILGPLLREYLIDGKVVTGLAYIEFMLKSSTNLFEDRVFGDLMARLTAAVRQSQQISLLSSSIAITRILVDIVRFVFRDIIPRDDHLPDVRYLAENGISTFPMNLTTASHFMHPAFCNTKEFVEQNGALYDMLGAFHGHVNLNFLEHVEKLVELGHVRGKEHEHHWLSQQRHFIAAQIIRDSRDPRNFMGDFVSSIRQRVFSDAYSSYPEVHESIRHEEAYLHALPYARTEMEYMVGLDQRLQGRQAEEVLTSISPLDLNAITIDMDKIFKDEPPSAIVPEALKSKKDLQQLEDVEIVIIRPNIEHNMLGIIMGLGGDDLGNTLWGQTELSVYDDSMHGIWGMSYKYHERAIVFNEKNLIRLWDIAYDGYNGGKDDTYVDWTNPDKDNGYKTFQRLTLDVSKNYRGPSMMVMAFVHDRDSKDLDGQPLFEKHFKRNWPSPIVFHDSYDPAHAPNDVGGETLPLDYDNLQVVDVKDFRVFNNELYHSSYKHYKELMPSFHEMHTMRKGAGQASADSETHIDSLAFQGSMRIKEAGGILAQEIHGSGHHGPDYTGVASVRAGKGQKVAGQAPTLHRLI